nr:immunoglobulin heavy chain junction region [Mus musculus]
CSRDYYGSNFDFW